MRSVVLLTAILLGACQSEPSFDERYDSAHQSIEAKAKELDAELNDTAEPKADRVDNTTD